jgi:hypothetical protein
MVDSHVSIGLEGYLTPEEGSPRHPILLFIPRTEMLILWLPDPPARDERQSEH